MKLATCRLPTSVGSITSRAPESLSVPWVQFGEEVLLYGPDEQWDSLITRARRTGLDPEPLPRSVERERLHLVIQKGDLFARDHPETILMDRGRFLVVDLDPVIVSDLNATGKPCYAIKPLPENTIVYAVWTPPARRAAPVPWVADLLSAFSPSSFEADLQHLVRFHTRLSTSSEYIEAAAWAQGQLSGMGYQTELREISIGNRRSVNVIAARTGHGTGPRQVVLVGAHLDSINHPGGASASAPGADDNGSGSAGVLAIARALQHLPAVHDLRLLLFGGEEQGLLGSLEYVASLTAAERTRVKAVVNMDMIATLNTPRPAVLLEGAPLSQRVIDGLADAAATYSDLVVKVALDPHDSDHVPFIDAGLPAVLTIEGGDTSNQNIHTGNDTLDHINLDLVHQILRMNVACVAQELGNSDQT